MKRNGALQPFTTLLATAAPSLFSGVSTFHLYSLIPFSHSLQMWPRCLTSSNPEAIHSSCSSSYSSLPSLMAAEPPRLLERPTGRPLESDEPSGSNKTVENGFSSASGLPQMESNAGGVCPASDINTRSFRKCFRRGGDPEFELLGDALRRGVDPTVIFRCLVDAFCEVGGLRESWNMFEKMVQMGWLPDSRAYSGLLNAMYDKGKAGTALFLLSKMSKLGCRPDVILYNRVLRSLSRCSVKRNDRESRSILSRKALELFQEMINTGVVPDSFTYFFFIKCCCSAGKVDLGLNSLADMLKRGCQSKRGMMNSLIYELIRENRIGEAYMLFDRMYSMGCKPNIYSFNAVLKAVCQTGSITEVLDLYVELKNGKYNCRPNMFTFNTVFGKLYKEQALDWALHMFDEMLACGFSPNVVTYNIFMHYLCQHKWMLKAHKLFDAMVEKGEKPTVVSYNILMHGYCLAGEMETAKQISEVMVANGLQPNTWSYNILCGGFFKNQDVHKVRDLLMEMYTAGIPYNAATFTLLISAYYKKGSLEDVSFYKRLMKEYGLDQNIITYSSQVQYYFSKDLVDGAVNLFKRMIDNNHQPDVVSYSILVEGYCTSGRIDEAYKCFREMYSKGLRPNTVICTILLRGLLSDNRVADAKQLYEDMHNHGVMPTLITYNVMIVGLVERGYLDEANEIFFHRDEYYYKLLFKRELVNNLFDRMKNVKKES